MKFTVAFVLVIVSMVSAEIPRRRIEIVRQTAPYMARGWKPQGQEFNLPLRQPAPSYGPPPEATTTEEPTTSTTTETVFFQQVKSAAAEPEEKKEEKEETKKKKENIEEQPGQYYVIVPQAQSLLYTVPKSAALVAVPRRGVGARLKAVPVAPASPYMAYGAPFVQYMYQ